MERKERGEEGLWLRFPLFDLVLFCSVLFCSVLFCLWVGRDQDFFCKFVSFFSLFPVFFFSILGFRVSSMGVVKVSGSRVRRWSPFREGSHLHLLPPRENSDNPGSQVRRWGPSGADAGCQSALCR